MDKFVKITTGFVKQTFEINAKGNIVCSEQMFAADGHVEYENLDGKPLENVSNYKYQSYDMVQPEKPKQFVVIDVSCDAEIGEPFECGSREEALATILEQQGYKIQEVKEVVEEEEEEA